MTESGPQPIKAIPSRRRTLLMGTGLQATAQIVMLVINLALTPYMIDGLGPERFSIYLLVSSISLMASSFDGGIGATAQRFFTLYAGSNDVDSRTRMLVSLVLITTVSTALIFPVVVYFAPHLMTFFKVDAALRAEAVFMLRSLIALTGVLVIRNLFNSLLFAHRRFVITASAAMASHLIFAAGMILTVERDWGLRGVALTLIAVQVFVSSVNVPCALQHLDRRSVGWMGSKQLREFGRYAWKMQLSSILTLLAAQKDQLVAGRLLGAQNSGPFGQGSNLAAQLRRLPMNALQPMQSVIGHDVGRGTEVDSLHQTERLQRVWVQLSTVWLALGVPTTYVGVRAWLPDSYDMAGYVVPVLLVGLYFQLAASVLVLWSLTVGRPDLQLEMLALGLVFNVGLSVALYPIFGMMGVVAATSLSNVLSALYLQWRASRALDPPLRSFMRDVPVIPMLGISGFTTVLLLSMEPLLPTGFPGILSAGALAVPGLLLAIVWLVPQSERARWAKMLTRRSD